MSIEKSPGAGQATGDENEAIHNIAYKRNAVNSKDRKNIAFKNLLQNAKPDFSFKCYEKVFTEEIARAAAGLILHTFDRGWVIFDPETGKFTGAEKQVRLYIGEMAKQYIAGAYKIDDEERRTAAIKFGAKILNARGIANVEILLRNEPEVSVDEKEFDANPAVVNCCGIAVDIYGNRRESQPGDLFTMSAAVKPLSGEPKRFLALMDFFSKDREELKIWVLSAMAICLFGFPSRLIINLYGLGQNAKGTILRILYRIMRDYAATLPRAVVVKSRYSSSRFDKANLPKKRAAFCFDLKVEPGE